MTTAAYGRGRARGGAVRWARVAAVALLAALAVLLHHETNSAFPPSVRATVMTGMAGMAHASSATMSMDGDGDGRDGPARASAPAAHGDDAGACSGMAMQHCSTAGVDGVAYMPPNEPWGGREGDAHATPAGRFVPGAVSRAPPDLSVLSRLLL
ncbi:hypothetical protein [Streptomyces sp. BRA346]|uniref:hypothetical protein n=1 Tax=Streptomyces sp. BRA346 TaxID=2878199 RepID=UPI004063BC75